MKIPENKWNTTNQNWMVKDGKIITNLDKSEPRIVNIKRVKR